MCSSDLFISHGLHGVRQGQDTVFPDKHRNRVILRMNRMLPAALKDHTIPEIMPFSPGQIQKQRRLSRSRLLSEKRDSLLPVCVSGLLYNLPDRIIFIGNFNDVLIQIKRKLLFSLV